jgi:hypothetical protein
VYVDTAQPEGKRLAAAFDLSGGPGLVLSNHAGDLQAFRHAGDLADADLARYLKRYTDPARVVRTTETNPPRYGSSSGSYYEAEQPVAPVVRPAVYYPRVTYSRSSNC